MSLTPNTSEKEACHIEVTKGFNSNSNIYDITDFLLAVTTSVGNMLLFFTQTSDNWPAVMTEGKDSTRSV